VERNCHNTIEKNIAAKENDDHILKMGKPVLRQQYASVKAVAEWISKLKSDKSN